MSRFSRNAGAGAETKTNGKVERTSLVLVAGLAVGLAASAWVGSDAFAMTKKQSASVDSGNSGEAGGTARAGAEAPLFEARTQAGELKKLSDHRGKWVLLYFYPKDDTPGCTKQACQIRDQYKEFIDAGVVVYGVSKQGAGSHQEFKKKYRLPFDLLVDEEGQIGKLYGIGSVFGFYHRQSVLIDPSGKIALFMDSVDPDTHASEILKFVKQK